MNPRSFTRMYRFRFGVLITRCLGMPLHADQLHADESPQAKLLVAIVVDQYSSDLFNEYRPLYTQGLARLAAGSDARKKTISPDSLRLPTLGDRMEARGPDSRVVAVSGKDRSAVMLGGSKADLTLWWTDGGFVTYSGMEARIPKEIGFEQPAAVETVDIAPTLAKLIGLDVSANEFDGRPLPIVVR